MQFKKASLLILKLGLFLAALLFVPQSLTDSFDRPLQFFGKHFIHFLLFLSIAIFYALIFLYCSGQDRDNLFRTVLNRIARQVFGIHSRRTVFICGGAVFVSVLLVSFLVYDNVPRVSDEIAQLFQARIFSTGRLYAPAPQLPEFFTYAEDNIIVTPRWYSQYPPGFSFLLSIGMMLGSPWIINPVLAALSVILIYLFCRELFDKNTAVLSAVLCALSPKVIFTSASLMNHTAAMFFMLLSFTCMVFALKRQGMLFSLCSGLALGAAVTVRTLDAVVPAIPIGIYGLRACLKNGRQGMKIMGLWLAGFCVMLAALMYYNYQTNGAPLLFGYIARWGKDHYLGFHEIRGGFFHTPYQGLINTLKLIRLNDKSLFEWPLSTTFILITFFTFARPLLWDWILLLIFMCTAALYFFWGWVDPLFMGRFYFIAAPCLIILTARWLLFFTRICSRCLAGGTFRAPAGGIAALAIALLFSWTGMQVRACYPALALAPEYYIKDLHVDRRVQKAVEENSIRHAIVFIEPQDKHELIIGSGFFMNTPDLASQDIVYAKDLGQKNKKLMELFPGRTAYLYRHKRSVRKLLHYGEYCFSPAEAFELVPLD